MSKQSLGELFLVLGSQEINLADFTREASDRWLKVTPQDTWSSTLSRVRIARQEALESTLEAIRISGFPDRGSSFSRILTSCGIENKSDVILAAVQYMRSVEKESFTAPRELKRLISETGKWTKNRFADGISLCILEECYKEEPKVRSLFLSILVGNLRSMHM